MGIVAYIDYTNPANDATVAAIAAEEDPAQVVLRRPSLFQMPDADPLERVVYTLDANTGIMAAVAAVGVTPVSIDDFMTP